ncbi:MAG: hypothetical protein QOG00_2863 [Pyrinomonadaceae bacterium]|nr:hypothetical protein [Pyrinomonadaceae bacterium]
MNELAIQPEKELAIQPETVIKPELLWPSPTLSILHKNIGELNRGLARIILEKERAVMGTGMPTTVAGLQEGLTTHWLEYNVLDWDYPEIKEFRKMVLNGLREYFKLVGDPDDEGFEISGISCWANVLRYGESLEVHHHDPGFVSAHYQVQSGFSGDEGDAENAQRGDSGNTVYFRPGFLDRSHGGKQAGTTSPWDTDWRISAPPAEGKLFFFPSYLRHEVRPYMGQGQRISIAMDVYVKKQDALIYFGPPRWFVPQR